MKRNENLVSLISFYNEGYERIALEKNPYSQPRHLYINNKNIVEALYVSYDGTICITNKWRVDDKIKLQSVTQSFEKWKAYNGFNQ